MIYPNLFQYNVVQATMATSSGEEASYVTDPASFVTGVTGKAILVEKSVVSQGPATYIVT